MKSLPRIVWALVCGAGRLCQHHPSGSMRLVATGPRTLLRLALLISLPSLVMFVYIFSQTLPMATKYTEESEKQAGMLPIVITVSGVVSHHNEIDGNSNVVMSDLQNKELDVNSNTVMSHQVTTQPYEPSEPENEGQGYALGVTNALSDIDFIDIEDNFDIFSIQSKYSEHNINSLKDVTSNDSNINLFEQADNEDGFMNIPTPPDMGALHRLPVHADPNMRANVFNGYNMALELPTAIRDAPNKPSPEDMEKYLMENYWTNKEKGFSDFSFRVTEEMIESGPLQLPELLPNLKVPCWVEEVPQDFTYKDNIYHCHINNRRIKAGFDRMFASYQLRQHYSGFKWRLRCLPSFYLIGVAKCGTTDLFEALTRHPQVLKPDLKEPEFWPYLRFGLNDLILNMTCARDKGHATFAEYMDTYDLTSEMVKESVRRDTSGDLGAKVIFGDYSTHTFIDIFDWDKTLDAPDQINAHHIYNVWPKSKFILILRDPIDRSYSRYKMRMSRGQNGGVKGTAKDYHKRVLKQVVSTNECLSNHTRRYCVYKAKYGVGSLGTNALLNTGLYSIYLRDWLSIFPRDQILILMFEDYIRNRPGTIEAIIRFLDIDSLLGPFRDIIASMAVVNASPEIGEMLPETREALQDFYRPYNRELVEMLQDNRFDWGY